MTRLKPNKLLVIFTIISLLGFSFILVKPSIDSINVNANSKVLATKTYIVVNSDSSTPLPSNFRVDKSLNISGSGQFTPDQLSNIKKNINHPQIHVIDLTQDSHGFINDTAISFYSPDICLNKGFSTSEILSTEATLLATIPHSKRITLYNTTTRPLMDVVVNSVKTEATVTHENALQYSRFPVASNSLPSPELVDQFVGYVKYQSHNSHLYFHCKSGGINTTTFMTMYQILNSTKDKSLEDIINYQISIGGVNIMNHSSHGNFINEFYNYVTSNKSNNFRVPYSKWISETKTR